MDRGPSAGEGIFILREDELLNEKELPRIFIPANKRDVPSPYGQRNLNADSSMYSASSASRNNSTDDLRDFLQSVTKGTDGRSYPETEFCRVNESCSTDHGRGSNDLERSQKVALVGDSDEGEEDCEEPFTDRAAGWRNVQHRGPRLVLGSSLGANDFNEELSADTVRRILNGGELLFSSEPLDGLPEDFSEKKPKIKNGYLFGDIIGEGSYAKVKEVVEQYSLVRRAVKIVKMSRVRKIPNGKENVEREIRLLRKINHKNVVELIEVFRNESKGKLYMVMEFCMGSVQQLIDSSVNKRLTEQKSHHLFVQLIRGLEYIHSLGIVHKDVKPANLLISAEFILKLSDFGVAEEIDLFQGNDKCSLVQGTPKFQAPELISGIGEHFSGFKADVWSSGITLFNMISGDYPFNGDVLMQLFTNIEHQELEMPANVKVGHMLERLLRGMLAKHPDERCSVDAIIHSEWFILGRVKDALVEEDVDEKKDSLYRPLSVGRALEMLYDAETENELIFVDDENGLAAAQLNEASITELPSSNVVPLSQRRRTHSFLNCFFRKSV